jgi:hypothetical protein
LLNIGFSGGGEENAAHLLAVFFEFLNNGRVHGDGVFGEDSISLGDRANRSEHVFAGHAGEFDELGDRGRAGQEDDGIPGCDLLFRNEIRNHPPEGCAIGKLISIEGSVWRLDVAESRDADLAVGEGGLCECHAFR